MSICYVVSSRYASVVVFGVPCLFLLSFVLSLTCASLQTWVTLLRQMAFCLAELHLWSTKSSLQVKGSTYHHVQSPSLSVILSLALSVITHFVFTPFPHLTYIYFSNLTLSQHQFSICLFSLSLCLFRFSCYQCLFIALYYVTFFILFFTTLNCILTLFKSVIG